MSESPTQPETIAPPKPSGSYAAMSSEQRSFMFWHAIVGAAIVNAILNALIAWLSVRKEDSVPRWAVPLLDNPSTISATVGTFFILPVTPIGALWALSEAEPAEP